MTQQFLSTVDKDSANLAFYLLSVFLELVLDVLALQDAPNCSERIVGSWLIFTRPWGTTDLMQPMIFPPETGNFSLSVWQHLGLSNRSNTLKFKVA